MSGYIVRQLPSTRGRQQAFLDNLKQNHITIILWGTSRLLPANIQTIDETSLQHVDPTKLNIYRSIVKKLHEEQKTICVNMISMHRVCFVSNSYQNAVNQARELLGSQAALDDFRLLGPTGFYHTILNLKNVRWEVLLLADVHQDAKDVPQLLENNRNVGTAKSITTFVHDKLNSNICLDLFMEQRKNKPQECSRSSTGYLSLTKCAMQEQCETLYVNDDLPDHAFSCVNTDSRVRVHALDFRTIDGIESYITRVQATPPSQLPMDLVLLWRSFANIVVLGSIQPDHVLWYTCSDTVCLTDYYSSLLQDLHRSFIASIFYEENNTVDFETRLGDCLIAFYQTVTPSNAKDLLSNIILSIDARLFDLSYVFNMFRTDNYSTSPSCDSIQRNVLLYAGYQHIQFIQRLIKCVFEENRQAEDTDLIHDPTFVISKADTKDGLGSGFVVTMISEPFLHR
jgi:hypothetical protein